MADHKPPHAATKPMVIIQAQRVGATVQFWRPPLEGWVPLGEPQRVATTDEGNEIAAPFIAKHRGALALVFDAPGSRSPFEGDR